MAYGYSAMVCDQRVFVRYNPFNVYVTQPEVKPGCVLRRCARAAAPLQGGGCRAGAAGRGRGPLLLAPYGRAGPTPRIHTSPHPRRTPPAPLPRTSCTEPAHLTHTHTHPTTTTTPTTHHPPRTTHHAPRTTTHHAPPPTTPPTPTPTTPRSNFSVLEKEKLVDAQQSDSCKRRMNTFAFVGDLAGQPQISCERAGGGWRCWRWLVLLARAGADGVGAGWCCCGRELLQPVLRAVPAPPALAAGEGGRVHTLHSTPHHPTPQPRSPPPPTHHTTHPPGVYHSEEAENQYLMDPKNSMKMLEAPGLAAAPPGAGEGGAGRAAAAAASQ
jgi:hypothetical protein